MPESDDLILLTEAAQAAGDIARHYWNRAPKQWDKPGEAGPVTEADLAVNDMLFRDLRAARPGYGWLSEETEDTPERLQDDTVFVVDPIDGTRAFIAGEKTFAHSLAVVRQGEVRAAVVYLPLLDRLYTAQADGPALLNGAPIATTQRVELRGASVLTTRANLHAALWRDGPPPLQPAFRASLAYRMCLVAEGRFDAMLTLRPTWEWDIAAGDLILRRAGAAVSDRGGQTIRYNAPAPRANGVIAAAPTLHAAFLAGLRPVPVNPT